MNKSITADEDSEYEVNIFALMASNALWGHCNGKMEVGIFHFDLRKHPQQVFWTFFSFFKYLFFIFFHLGYLGVEGAMCKILELYDQNPRSNN